MSATPADRIRPAERAEDVRVAQEIEGLALMLGDALEEMRSRDVAVAGWIATAEQRLADTINDLYVAVHQVRGRVR